jgi:hypothetical protein
LLLALLHEITKRNASTSHSSSRTSLSNIRVVDCHCGITLWMWREFIIILHRTYNTIHNVIKLKVIKWAERVI